MDGISIYFEILSWGLKDKEQRNWVAQVQLSSLDLIENACWRQRSIWNWVSEGGATKMCFLGCSLEPGLCYVPKQGGGGLS